MRYTVRPISDRTPFTGTHEWTPFRATWQNTLDLLGVELDHLDATDVVLEVDVTAGQVRVDGQLRADAEPSSPAVRLAFDSRVGPLVYATDRYRGRYYDGPADWQENVRAIALGLEALRRVDRYGITRRGEQYAGWAALPAGTGAAPAGGMTSDQACAVIARASWPNENEYDRASWAPRIGSEPDFAAKEYRRARANAHPDRHDGNRRAWDDVQQAGRTLGLDR